MDFQIPYNLYRQQYKQKTWALYHALRDTILQGALSYGTRLPATRELAALYGLSRGLVSDVYDMLAADGYLTSEVGRGTYVTFATESHAEVQQELTAPPLSAWGRRLLDLPIPQPTAHPRPAVRCSFTIGRTDWEQFPHAEWNRCLHGAVREMQVQERSEAFHAGGHRPLREALARHLGRSRGLVCEADDIVIVNGSMQAIALLAQLLVNPGDPVVMEDPGYRGIWQAVVAAGGTIVPARVDQHGLVIADWAAQLLFVTPTRQFPTGAVLPLERRQELLAWAARRGAVVVEDEFDSEFRHAGRPIEPLQVLDPGGRVVYIGTFSKTMFSDLRLGYVVLPKWLREPFQKARSLYEPHPTALLQQRAMARFIAEGEYERHLRRMKRVYARKHDSSSCIMQELLGAWFEFVPSDAGLHLFGWWRGTRPAYEAFRTAAREAGIVWPDVDPYNLHESRSGALFGFAHLSEEEVRAAAESLREIALGL